MMGPYAIEVEFLAEHLGDEIVTMLEQRGHLPSLCSTLRAFADAEREAILAIQLKREQNTEWQEETTTKGSEWQLGFLSGWSVALNDYRAYIRKRGSGLDATSAKG